MSDSQVRACLRSFRRVLRRDGILIIHVKNLASPYLATLCTAKAILRKFGRRKPIEEYFRPFDWYVRELKSAGFEIESFNSFNLFVLERMPQRLVEQMQRIELTRRKRFPFSLPSFRRHGADLKFRARVVGE